MPQNEFRPESKKFNMLCKLSVLILNKLLTSWLTLPEVGRVASVLLCSSTKHVLLESLRLGNFCGDMIELCNSEAFLSWVSKHKVCVRLPEIVLNSILVKNGELRNAFFSVVGKFLRKVTSKASPNMSSGTIHALLDVSLYCTNLQDLEMQSYDDSVVVALLGRNPNLRRVSLHDCSEGESHILHSIVQLCPSIESIEIHSVLSHLTVQLFTKTVSSTLQKLNIPKYNLANTWQCIIDILTKCRFLRELHVGLIPCTYNENGQLPVFPQLVLFCGEFVAHVAYRFLEGLARLTPNLQTLICGLNPVSGYPTNSDKYDLWTVVPLFPCLRQFADDKKFKHLLRAHPLPPMSVACLPGTHYLIEELYCQTYTYNLSQLFERCPALRGMNARRLGRPSDLLLPYDAFKLKSLHVHDILLHDSEVLHLSGLEELEMECGSWVSDKSMGYIALRNPLLKVTFLNRKALTHVTNVTQLAPRACGNFCSAVLICSTSPTSP